MQMFYAADMFVHSGKHAQASAIHQPISSTTTGSGLNCICVEMLQSVNGCCELTTSVENLS